MAPEKSGKHAKKKKKVKNGDNSTNVEDVSSDFDTDTDDQKNKLDRQKILDIIGANSHSVNDMYLKNDKGPFYVMLEKDNISHFEVGKLLYSLKFDVIEVLKSGKKVVRIKCNDRLTANKILVNQVIASKGYKSFISELYANTVGIARDVPLEWTEEEIIEFGTCGSRILKVERMTYYDRENKVSKPSKSVKITFRSYKLPNELKIYNVITKLVLFIPRPLLCKNCVRYGHTAKYCKNDRVCVKCVSTDHYENCTSDPKCFYCADNKDIQQHSTNADACPEKKVQIEVKKVMVTDKIPFFEASKVVRKNFRLEKQKTEFEKNAQTIVTLKSQVDFNENLLKQVSKVINNFCSGNGSDADVAASFGSIQNAMYSFMVRNSLICAPASTQKKSTVNNLSNDIIMAENNKNNPNGVNNGSKYSSN